MLGPNWGPTKPLGTGRDPNDDIGSSLTRVQHNLPKVYVICRAKLILDEYLSSLFVSRFDICQKVSDCDLLADELQLQPQLPRQLGQVFPNPWREVPGLPRPRLPNITLKAGDERRRGRGRFGRGHASKHGRPATPQGLPVAA
jgi:hypothetical protein